MIEAMEAGGGNETRARQVRSIVESRPRQDERQEQIKTVDIKEEEQGEARVELRNLEKLNPEFTDKNVREILDTLPRGWLGKDLVLKYFDHKGPNNAVAGRQREILTPGLNVIGIFKDASKKTAAEICEAIFHEVAHANDWDGNWQLISKDENQFKDEVLSRMQSADRFFSDYVENTDWEKMEEPAYVDERPVELKKACEYWATIAKTYLMSPDPEKVLPAADVALVKKIIGATDPTFDQKQSFENRSALLNKMETSEVRRNIEKALQSQYLGVHERQRLENFKLNKVEQLETGERKEESEKRTRLVNFLKEQGKDPETRKLLQEYLGAKISFEQYFDQLKNKNIEEATLNFDLHVMDRVKLDVIMASAPQEKRDVVKQLEELLEREHLQVGGGEQMEEGEYQKMLVGEDAEPDWVFNALQWRIHEKDAETMWNNSVKWHPVSEEVVE